MTTAAASSQSALDLERAYQACRDVARRRARNFYYGLRLTPEPQRSAVFSIYAWMRRGDDLVDDVAAPDAKRERLNAFEQDTRRVLRGQTPNGDAGDERDLWAAFAHTIDAFDVSERDIDAMLEGLREDIDPDGYDTFDDLKRYCSRVASSVGRVCVTIWGVRQGMDREDALRLAERRGLAFQLTNILRDFAEDYDEGRVYLPRRSFEEAGLTPEQLRRWSDPERCERFVASCAAAARREFGASSALERMVNPSCAPTLWAMTRIYSGLLAKIEQRPSRIVSESRIRLQSVQKATIAMRALVMSRRGAW